MKQPHSSAVWIAGAGPGDPDLITVKALKAIKQADVILYDALVSTALLKYAPSRCRLVYVGKRKSKKEFSQEEINELIVFYASRYKNVLRLKGGDPYVYGRGHEELEYLTRKGITAEMIPGITSAVAAPAAAGIPVTKRGVTESFWVVTGMLASRQLPHDLILAAQSSATVVILMGITHLNEIMKIFASYRSTTEPAAVIQQGTTVHQKVITGTVTDIPARVQEGAVEAPAVIVIGKVVLERNVLDILKKKRGKMEIAV